MITWSTVCLESLFQDNKKHMIKNNTISHRLKITHISVNLNNVHLLTNSTTLAQNMTITQTIDSLINIINKNNKTLSITKPMMNVRILMCHHIIAMMIIKRHTWKVHSHQLKHRLIKVSRSSLLVNGSQNNKNLHQSVTKLKIHQQMDNLSWNILKIHKNYHIKNNHNKGKTNKNMRVFQCLIIFHNAKHNL